MGRPLRYQKADAIYFVTNRTRDQQYLFKPCKEVNQIILGLLAKLADKYDIEIFAFVIMSNHFHMLVRSQGRVLHRFMGEFQQQLTIKLQKLWGYTGSSYERRFTATEILDDQALLDKLRYTICNPCESNLVRHPKQWPGLTSWTIHETKKPMVGKVVNRKRYWAIKRTKAGKEMSETQLLEKATEEYELEMAKLPMFEDLDEEAYHQQVLDLCEDYARELDDKRIVPCVGRKDILAQKWYDSPNNPKKAPRPICHTTSAEKRKEYFEELWEVTDRYKQAVGKFRKGKTQVQFPEGTIPPGHLYCVGGECLPVAQGGPPGG